MEAQTQALVQGPRLEGNREPRRESEATALLLRRPASPDQRIIYTVLECQPLFDSSDMTITEWVQIAQTIEVAGSVGGAVLTEQDSGSGRGCRMWAGPGL